MANGNERNFTEKMGDKFDEMKTKAQAKGAEFRNDGDQSTLNAQAKQKEALNDAQKEYEQRQKDRRKEMKDHKW